MIGLVFALIVNWATVQRGRFSCSVTQQQQQRYRECCPEQKRPMVGLLCIIRARLGLLDNLSV